MVSATTATTSQHQEPLHLLSSLHCWAPPLHVCVVELYYPSMLQTPTRLRSSHWLNGKPHSLLQPLPLRATWRRHLLLSLQLSCLALTQALLCQPWCSPWVGLCRLPQDWCSPLLNLQGQSASPHQPNSGQYYPLLRLQGWHCPLSHLQGG